MKKLILLVFIVLILSLFVSAKNKVSADDILAKIDRQEPISYEGVIVSGDLDFTKIKDKVLKKSGGKNSTRLYHYNIHSPISFKNCTFTGDVLAYVHDDDQNITHNAMFYEDVTFKGCEFKGLSAFKYSKFYKKTDFQKSAFSYEALFKYSKFTETIRFSHSSFNETANFKYAKFPRDAYFNGVTFQEYANFKYTKFYGHVSFEKAVFEGEANFKYTKFYDSISLKYTKFPASSDFTDTQFKGSINSKYTKIDGVPFKKHFKR